MDKSLNSCILELYIAVGNLSFLTDCFQFSLKQKGGDMNRLTKIIKLLFSTLGVIAELLPAIDSELRKRSEKVLEVNKVQKEQVDDLRTKSTGDDPWSIS